MPVPVDDSVALVYRDRYVYLVSGWHETVQRQPDATLRYCNRHLASGHALAGRNGVWPCGRHRGRHLGHRRRRRH